MLPMYVQGGQLLVNLTGLEGSAAVHITLEVLDALLASAATPSIFVQIVQSLF